MPVGAWARFVYKMKLKMGKAKETDYSRDLVKGTECVQLLRQNLIVTISEFETVMQPNPNLRNRKSAVSEMMRKEIERSSVYQHYGEGLKVTGSTLLDVDGAQGKMIVKMGVAEKLCGQAENTLAEDGLVAYSEPMKKFLEDDVKNAIKEYKQLEKTRSEHDVILKKRNAAQTKLGSNPSPADQKVFDKIEENYQTMRTTLDREVMSYVNLANEVLLSKSHINCLEKLVAAQIKYHEHCIKILKPFRKGAGGDKDDDDKEEVEKEAQNNNGKEIYVLINNFSEFVFT